MSADIYGSWDFSKLSPIQIKEKTSGSSVIAHLSNKYDEIGRLKPSEISYTSVFKPLLDLEREGYAASMPLTFPSHVATDKELRDACSVADKVLEDFSVEISMRKDIFDNLVAFSKKQDLNSLTPEEKRVLEHMIKNGKRNGLHLPMETQDKIKSTKKRISELCINFTKNLNEDVTALSFTEEELTGVPPDLISTLDKTEDGKLKVTMKYPHFFPVTRKCHVPSTRKAMESAYQSRCMKENTEILEELVSLRHRHAQLLGYENHAAYIHEIQMAKNPANVHKFLSELADKLQVLWVSERKAILRLKKEECDKYGYEYDGIINFWDMRYYMALIEERQYSVDQTKLREYFPIDVVTEGLLSIYQDLLGLTFTQVKDAEIWHEDVILYSVQDRTSRELLGYFFLDLYPREGKYGHAAMFGLQPGCLNKENNREVHVVAMVANLTKPTAEKPSLLNHDEVETYFHEFGHVMHQICSRTESALFSGTRVERDFLETPSQMLENWVWEKEPLAKMSSHYKDGSPIPDHMVEKLLASKKANAGAFNLRQIVLATFDQSIHTCPSADTQQIFADLYQRIMGITTMPGTNMPANFGHMAGGYPAQYYGYLWSEVFSMDMFESRFNKEGVMNPSVGKDYRRCVLEPGGSQDASAMLRNFLGREPNPEAFLRSKGLQPEL